MYRPLVLLVGGVVIGAVVWTQRDAVPRVETLRELVKRSRPSRTP